MRFIIDIPRVSAVHEMSDTSSDMQSFCDTRRVSAMSEMSDTSSDLQSFCDMSRASAVQVESARNLVIRPKSSSVTRSRFSEISDQLGIALYIVMSQTVM